MKDKLQLIGGHATFLSSTLKSMLIIELKKDKK